MLGAGHILHPGRPEVAPGPETQKLVTGNRSSLGSNSPGWLSKVQGARNGPSLDQQPFAATTAKPSRAPGCLRKWHRLPALASREGRPVLPQGSLSPQVRPPPVLAWG